MFIYKQTIIIKLKRKKFVNFRNILVKWGKCTNANGEIPIVFFNVIFVFIFQLDEIIIVVLLLDQISLPQLLKKTI